MTVISWIGPLPQRIDGDTEKESVTPVSEKTIIYELEDKPARIIILPNYDKGSTGSSHISTDSFILSSLQESAQEKMQLLETFSELGFSVNFFGERPKTYSLSGYFLETKNTDNYTTFQNLYNNHLRSTLLVKNNKIAILKVYNNNIEFYPLSLNIRRVANSPYSVEFAMNILVVRHTYPHKAIINTELNLDIDEYNKEVKKLEALEKSLITASGETYYKNLKERDELREKLFNERFELVKNVN